jgi:two-component system phosphate regulon sensor histidine kinase PhoR
MLNFKREDLIGHPFSTTGQNKCLTLLTACQKENIPLRETMTLTNPIKGSKAYVDIVGAPQRDNNGAILVMQDQTSHYRVLEMKKDFVANASHELKTPITIIRGFAETLHDHPELPLETQAEVLATIVHSCDRMTHTIKNLLALSDVENLPESRLEECDLIKIAENCKEMVLNIHPTANIQIQDISGHGILLIADPHLMELALINLIENAAKYSPPPAQIIVSMEDVKDRIIIRVSDKGIGIPNPDLDQIFEKFYTVNKAYSQRMGGSGLGLSIVKTIIEKHFGQISVESVLGEGSTFIISLPKSYLSIS